MACLIKEKVLSDSLKESIFFKKNQSFFKNPQNTSTLCEQHLQKWKKISFKINSQKNQLRISIFQCGKSYMNTGSVQGLCGKCLLEFIYINSYWYFRPNFVNYFPSHLLSGSGSAPPPSSQLCQSYITLQGIYCRKKVTLHTPICNYSFFLIFSKTQYSAATFPC